MINDYWERAEFPWPLIKQMGELGHRRRRHRGLRLPADEPARRRAGQHGAQPRRRQPRHLPRRAGRPGDAVDRHARLGGAEAALAARDGHAGEARRVRPDRADARLGLGGAGDLGPPRRRRVGDQRRRRSGSATAPSPTSSWCGPGTAPTARSRGSWWRRAHPGYDARRIDGKGSLRAVWQAEITLTDVRVPEENRLPGASSFKDAGRVLAGTRNTVAWGALGHATAAYEVAVAYCQQREQFGKPLVELPDRAGQAGPDARRGLLDAAVLPAAGPAASRRAS